MIRKITVTNEQGEALLINLNRPRDTGIFITNITGLGPPVGQINVTDFATIDGSLYNSARAQMRNIVFSVRLLSPDVEATRHLVYQHFQVKKKVRLLFEADARTCWIDGYVENVTPSIFTPQEAIQISVLCPDPYFRANTVTRDMYYRAAPGFHFPIGTTENPGPYELGILGDNYQVIDIDYTGDADTGVLLYLEMDGQVGGEIVLTNSSTHETMRIDTTRVAVMTGQALGVGDAIEISTIPGDKFINIIRDGEPINLISALSKDSDWLSLTVGRNQYAYVATSGKENIVVRVEYATAFVGV